MRDNHGTMGEQSAKRLKRDDYQHLYSWFERTPTVDTRVSVSVWDMWSIPEAGAAADITLHPRIRQDWAKYTQVKFHVDRRAQFSSAALIKRSHDDPRSLLHKFTNYLTLGIVSRNSTNSIPIFRHSATKNPIADLAIMSTKSPCGELLYQFPVTERRIRIECSKNQE